MSTEKLYYTLPYEKTFKATIISISSLPDGRCSVVLDKTLFYPESGGQPFDIGTIDTIPVLEVREADDTIVHILPEKPTSSAIQGCIKWDRRFDHMQQHTGQHILSAAFQSIAQTATIGFHLGKDSSQIDLAVDNLTIETIQKVEILANEIIYANLPIKSHTITKENVAHFPIRKIPEKDFDVLRLVQIGDFDYSLCCGTHVSATGEIGIIKIRSFERKNNALRIDFVCGSRALADYTQKNRIIQYLSAGLSAPVSELPAAYDKQQMKMEALNKQVLELKNQLYHMLADSLQKGCSLVSNLKIIDHVLEDALPNDLATLAKELLTQPQTIILLAGVNPERTKAHLLFSTNSNISVNMNDLLKATLPLIEGKGGGNAQTAQGGGSNLSKLTAALELAKDKVLMHLK